MKKIVFILLTVITFDTVAQDMEKGSETNYFPSEGISFSFDTKISQLHGEYVAYSGFRMGLVTSSKYVVGLGGYELSGQNTFTYFDDLDVAHNFRIEVEYGGLFLETTFLSKGRFRLYNPLLIGGGKSIIKEKVILTQHAFDDAHNRDNDYWATVEESGFFIIDSSLQMKYALADWAHLGAGIGYKSVIGNNLMSLPKTDRDLSTFSFDIGLTFVCF